MTKKSKLILGSASLTAVIAIVPAAVISCGADTSTTDNKTTVDNNATALTKINATADTNADKTATEVAKLLPNNSTNLDPLSSYFNTNLIVSAATKNGVKATYSASVAVAKTSTTAVLTSTASDTSNTLIITVTMTLGSATSTQAINVTGFPTQDQATLNSLSTTLSSLKLNALPTQNVTSPVDIYAALKDKTSLVDFDTYFDTSSISTAITTASSTIATTYAITNPSQKNITDGSISITISLTLGTATKTVNLTISGFLSANQGIVNSYIKSITDLSGDNVIKAKSGASLPATITNSDYVTYLDNVPTPATNSGITLSFVLSNPNPVTGTVEITITASISGANAATASTTAITVSGFTISNVAVVNAYVAKINALSGDNIIKAKSGASLPSTITNANYNTILDNVPAPFDGVTLSFALSNSNATTGIVYVVITASISGANAATASTGTITVSGFLTTNQAAVNTYIKSITDLSGDNTIKAVKGASLPTTITNSDYTTYLDNVPALPSGITLSFALSNSNATTGTVDVVITASIAAPNAATASTGTITVSGFLTTNQTTVDTYIKSITDLSGANVIKAINDTTTLPTALTNENYSTYLTNVPTPTNGTTLSFALSNSNATTGTVDVVITASIAAPNAATASTGTITVSGFLTTNQAVVNAYIDSFTNADITGKNTYLPASIPSVLTPANINTYFNNIPVIPANITVAFSSSLITNTGLTLSITVSAATNATEKSTGKVISGFGTDTSVLSTLASSLTNGTYEVLSTQQSKTPTQIYDTLAPTSNLQLSDFNTYFTTTRIQDSINAISTSIAISSIELIKVSTANLIAGTLEFTINLSLNGATASATITLSNLTKETASDIKQANLASLTTISNNLKSSAVTTTKVSETSDVAYTAINKISSLATIEQLSDYFTSSSITDIINSVSGVTYAELKVENPTTLDNLNGIITFSLTLSLGTSPDTASINTQFTIKGFSTPLNTSLNASLSLNSVYANYWTTTPSSSDISTLGHSADTISLYIGGDSPFNSSATLTSSGTSLPSFLNNINWPVGLSNSDVTSWVETGDNTSGTATYTLTVNGITKPITLTVSGFMKADRTTIFTGMSVTLTEQSTIPTPSNGSVTSLSSIGINSNTGINWNNLTMSDFGPSDGAAAYKIVNSNPTLGTANFVITLPNGNAISFPISGYLTTSQQAVDTYIDSVNATIGTTGAISGKGQDIPSTVSNDTFSTYFNNIPKVPTGVTLTFVLSNPNPETGTVDIVITATDGTSTKASNKITVSGFLASNQTLVDTYIKSITNLSGANVIKAINDTTELPIALTNENYSTYLTNVPAPTSGITLSFELNTPDPTTGTVNITITATIGSISQKTSISVTGFLTTNQKAISAYITAFEASTSIIKGIDTILPSDITSTSNISMTDIAKYFSGIVKPISGITATFNITTTSGDSGSDVTGIVGLTVTLAADHAIGATSTSINISGFLTKNQAAVNAYIKLFKDATATIKGVNTYLPSQVPSTLDISQINTYFTGVPPISSSEINATFTTDASSNANGTISLTLNLTAIHAKQTSTTITVSGFKTVNQILKSQIDAINLSANADFPAPVLTTTALALQDAQPIFTTLDLNKAQISTLNSISGLTTSVTASSITDGTATLEYSATIDGTVATYSQLYSGFLKGNSSDIKTHLESYLSDPTKVTTFLQNYLDVNQTFLNDLMIKNVTGGTYWSYVTSTTVTNNNFKDIVVSYDTNTKTYIVTATTINAFDLTIVSTSSSTPGNVIPANTQMIITLPFVFSGTLDGGYSPLNIAVSDSGSVTLSWDQTAFNNWQATIGVTMKYIPKGSTELTGATTMGWRNVTISSIIF